MLSFAAYAAGSDELLPTRCPIDGHELRPACVLELTHELDKFLEHEFSVGLLQQGLLSLLPWVHLGQTLLTRNEPARNDYPFLSDADVDTLVEWCEARQYPGRKRVINQLLETVLR